MTATGIWPPLAAPLLNGIALMLALGFHRNRAVLVLTILTFSSFALAGVLVPEQSDRGADAARMFAPWLLLAAAALPERSLLARRNLVLLLLLAIAAWLTLAAPAHVWPGLRGALPLGALPWSAGTIAAALTFTAAALCILRWVLNGAPMEAGLGLVLAFAGVALMPVLRVDAVRTALALAGACSLGAVLYASYRMAFVDALSSLPNRRALDETLTRLTSNYALAMVDIDHFKQFNDTHGHDAGDVVLRAVAQQLRRTRGARAFRYGGEEFCLLFAGARSKGAAQACEEARARVEAARVRIRSAPKQRRGQAVKRGDATEVKVTVSIGLAERDASARHAGDVLKSADQALYKAKAKGRNRVVAR
ncbi:MAG TPA: GGDEF domain-containing protein [Rudaea sp.]|nr:GGDEF domain-containing protein [Rudaea sp.]